MRDLIPESDGSAIPGLHIQIAACEWAEKEARELRRCGIDPQTGKYIPAELPATPRPVEKLARVYSAADVGSSYLDVNDSRLYTSDPRPHTTGTLSVQAAVEMSAEARRRVERARKDAELAQEKQRKVEAERARRRQQHQPESEWASKRLLRDALAASEFKERLRRGLSPLPALLKPKVQAQPFEPTYTVVGAHRRVYWNFTSGLFTCADCNTQMAVTRDMRFITCAPTPTRGHK